MSKLTAPTSILAGLTRRRFLGLAAGAAVVVAAGPAAFGGFPAEAAASDSVQKIADHFSGIKTMTGEFVQFGPRGEQSGGKFYMQRPGRIRFDYDGAARFRVVADGRSVVIENRKMNTMDLYPLSKTPLKLLLDDRIDLSGSKVQSVKEEDDLTTIKLSDKQVFGNALITMMFDPKSYELRQWTITDAQGKDTTVMIFNTRQGVKFEDSMFAIDYRKNDNLNAPGR